MNERLRFPIESLEAALRLPAGCSPPETILAAVAGELPAEVTAGILAHAERCAACGAELELARAYAAPVAETEAEDVAWIVERTRGGKLARPHRPAEAKVLPMRPRRGIAIPPATARWVAAAAVLLVAGLTLFGLRAGRAPELPERPLEEVLRGGAIAWSMPLGALAEAPSELAWRGVEGAARYRIEIRDVAGREVVGGETPATRWAVQPGILETLVTYTVQVTAYDASGRVIAASEASELRVEPARE